MAQPPECADQRCPFETFVLAHDGRNRDKVIGIERMLDAQQ